MHLLVEATSARSVSRDEKPKVRIMIYEGIRLEETHGLLSTRITCQLTGVSRTAYQFWLNQKPPILDPEEEVLVREIKAIAVEFTKYGYRRIKAELDRRKICVNRKKVLKIMKKQGLLAKQKKAFKIRTTNSDHGFLVYSNLAKDLEPTDINQLWVADITYVRIIKGHVYLAVIIDVYSRKCVGWELNRSLDAQLSLNALHMAIKKRKPLGIDGLIHHSDQGVQYACNEYTALLEENKIRISMSAKGNPYDNAFAESFIKTLKQEEVYLTEYEDFNDAYTNIEKFIEKVYNKKRLHSSLGYKPPDEYEEEMISRRGS